MREYFYKTKAKIVIWLYFEGNDLSDLGIEMDDNILKKYLEDDQFSQQLVTVQERIDKKINSYIKLWESHNQSSGLIKFLKLKTLSHFIEEQTKPLFTHPASVTNFRTVLLKSVELVQKEKSKLYFVFIPARERYYGKLKDSETQLEILQMVRDMNIPIINMDSEFVRQEANPLSFFSSRHGYHLNERGYQTVAAALLKNLR